MIINIISDIKKIVLEIALFTLTLCILLYALLVHGVEIPKLNIGSLHISKLYLKLDKKLILSIDSLQLPQNRSKNQLPDQIAYINFIGKYFQTIDIRRLKMGNERIELHYDSNLFTAKSPTFEAKITLHYDRTFHRLIANIENYTNKKLGLALQGKVRIYKKNRIFATLSYTIEGIDGKAKFLKIGNELSFWLNSKTFTNPQLKKLFTHFKLHPLIKAWSYQKIKAKRYRLLYAKGKIDLDHIDPAKIEAKAIGEDVKVWFQKGIDPVHIQKVTLLYQKDNLFFHLTKPRYHSKNLTGSKVRIYHLTKSNSFIDVDLKTNAPLDEDIRKIVRSYGIGLPLIQKRGSVEASLRIRVHFKSGKVHLKGAFATHNSLFNLDGIDLAAHKLFVKLIDTRIIIKESLLELPPFIKAHVDGAIDLKKGQGKLHLSDGAIHVTYNDFSLLEIPQLNGDLLINLSTNTITFPSLNFIYNIAQKSITITHLEDLKGYSPLLQELEPTSATIHYDLLNQIAIVEFQKSQSPFIKHSPITHFRLTLDLPKKEAKLNDFATIHFAKKPVLFLHDVTLDLAQLKESKRDLEIVAHLANVTLQYDNHRLHVEKGVFRKENGKANFTAQLNGGTLKVQKDKKLSLQANNLLAKTLNQLIGKTIFHQGRYRLEAVGTKKELHGTLHITDGYLKDLKLINNFFAFLNTIPALMTLSDPGFDKTGFLIKRGKVDFIYTDDKLIFSHIKLRSISMDIVGSGYIDLKTKSITMKLDLQTLKNVAKVIKNFPLAGYILLGKDGTISTAVEVYGTLKDPKFRSLLPSQTIKMPFNILKRTLELPFKIFE